MKTTSFFYEAFEHSPFGYIVNVYTVIFSLINVKLLLYIVVKNTFSDTGIKITIQDTPCNFVKTTI